MGEYIIKIIEHLSSVELVASAAAVFFGLQAACNALGELFERLGNFGKQSKTENWLDSTGAAFRAASKNIGVFLNFFSLGNKQRS